MGYFFMNSTNKFNVEYYYLTPSSFAKQLWKLLIWTLWVVIIHICKPNFHFQKWRNWKLNDKIGKLLKLHNIIAKSLHFFNSIILANQLEWRNRHSTIVNAWFWKNIWHYATNSSCTVFSVPRSGKFMNFPIFPSLHIHIKVYIKFNCTFFDSRFCTVLELIQ